MHDDDDSGGLELSCEITIHRSFFHVFKHIKMPRPWETYEIIFNLLSRV